MDNGELILGREIHKSGRTTARISQRPVPIQILQQVGSLLILDQCDDGLSGQPTGATNSGCGTGASADNGNLWICQAINVCSQQGSTYLSRAPGNRNQIQHPNRRAGFLRLSFSPRRSL